VTPNSPASVPVKRMEVLKWGTPLEGEFSRDMFAVEFGLHATPVPYRGPSVKRIPSGSHRI